MGLVMDLADRVMVVDFGVPIAIGHARRRSSATQTSSGPTWARSTEPPGVRYDRCRSTDQHEGHHVATRVRDRVATCRDRVALREKDFGIWQEVTLGVPTGTRRAPVGHALLALGVEPGDRVAIHSENRREWLYSDVGALAVRAMTVGLYPTNPAAEVGYLLADSGARVLIAEDQEQVDKALEVLDQCPSSRTIVYVEPRGIRHRYHRSRSCSPGTICWPSAPSIARRTRARSSDAWPTPPPDDIATLIYTSGTTGPPKGAMLSVSNVEFAITDARRGRRLHRAAAGPARPDPVLPAAVPRCRADLHHLVQRRRRRSGQLRRVDRRPCSRTCARCSRPSCSASRGSGRQVLAGVHHRSAQRLAGSSGSTRRCWLAASPTDRRHPGPHRRAAHPRHRACVYAIGWVCCYRALRERIGMRKVRYAAVGRGARSRPRCSGSSWASGCRCTRSTG